MWPNSSHLAAVMWETACCTGRARVPAAEGTRAPPLLRSDPAWVDPSWACASSPLGWGWGAGRWGGAGLRRGSEGRASGGRASVCSSASSWSPQRSHWRCWCKEKYDLISENLSISFYHSTHQLFFLIYYISISNKKLVNLLCRTCSIQNILNKNMKWSRVCSLTSSCIRLADWPVWCWWCRTGGEGLCTAWLLLPCRGSAEDSASSGIWSLHWWTAPERHNKMLTQTSRGGCLYISHLPNQNGMQEYSIA